MLYASCALILVLQGAAEDVMLRSPLTICQTQDECAMS